MRVAIVGTKGIDSKLLVDSLDHLTGKLEKPAFLILPKQGYVEMWLSNRLHFYQIYHEGLEPMVESADALIAFESDKETKRAVRLAEKKGIKIKKVR